MDEIVRIFSYGGGVQSFATLLLQSRGELEKPFDLYIFANVGADSEKPSTLDHIESIVLPLAVRSGIPFLTVTAKTREGNTKTLHQEITGNNRSIRFPAYMSGGAPGNRSCTVDYKVRPVQKAIRSMYAGKRIALGIGFSVDEMYRAKRKPTDWHEQGDKSHKLGFTQQYTFPLIDRGMSRNDCHAFIQRAGYQVPSKSACWFCPFTSKTEWIEMRRADSEMFSRCVALERRINEKRSALGKDNVYLHSSALPLVNAVPEQAGLFESFWDADNECQTGYCGL